MKRIIYNLIILFIGSLSFVSCGDEETEREQSLSIADFYPTIVMEGIKMTVTGTNMDVVDQVVFPGGVTSSDITVKDEFTLQVIAPVGISDVIAPLILKSGNIEVESRQTIRKANPAFNSYLFADKDGAVTKSNMTIIGNDLLQVEKIMFVLDEKSRTIDAFQMLRKSNTSIKFTIPEDSPIGEGIQVKLVFKNGTEMDLQKIEIIDYRMINNPFANCDPITSSTIMLTDFEHGHEPCVSDPTATEDRIDQNGNTYLYVTKPIPNGSTIFECLDHVDVGTISGIENYVVKFDFKIDEGVVGASKASMVYIIGWNWSWVGENFFPETTDGQWITVSRDISSLNNPNLVGNFFVGMGLKAFLGDRVPAGISIDNYRLDPKKE